MRKIIVSLVSFMLLFVSVTAATADAPSPLMESMVTYLEIGAGDFSRYDMATYMSATGYDAKSVVFDFDLCPGNQMLRVTCGQDASCYMVVSVSQPDRVLEAFVTLLPYFDEIQASLPDGYKLAFRVYNGEVRSERYAIIYTKDGYSTEAN